MAKDRLAKDLAMAKVKAKDRPFKTHSMEHAIIAISSVIRVMIAHTSGKDTKDHAKDADSSDTSKPIARRGKARGMRSVSSRRTRH